MERRLLLTAACLLAGAAALGPQFVQNRLPPSFPQPIWVVHPSLLSTSREMGVIQSHQAQEQTRGRLEESPSFLLPATDDLGGPDGFGGQPGPFPARGPTEPAEVATNAGRLPSSGPTKPLASAGGFGGTASSSLSPLPASNTHPGLNSDQGPQADRAARRALVDANPALHALNQRVFKSVFDGQNEVVCTFCLLQVLTAAYQLGNAKVRDEIKEALQSPAPAELSDVLLAAADAEPTLNGTLMGYYRPGAFAACDRTAGTKQQARCKGILDFVRGRGSAVDFAKPETVRLINSQVERATNGKIPDLFTSLPADTSLVFASALVFSDKWQSQLSPHPGVFHTAAGPVNTEMLFTRETLPLLDGSTDGVVGVSLPYRSDGIRMFLFTTTDGSPVQDKLGRQHYQELAGARRGTYTAVTLPSFSIASKKRSYIDLIQQMGAGEMFIGGLGADDQLRVDQLVHKAVISSDRHGTEAAGAAAIALVPLSAKPQPFQARFDRPFVCSLVHVELGVPIFTAHIVDPTQK